jgi:hypothetical protein
MLGTTLKYGFFAALLTGLLLSMHDTYWHWALLPAVLVWITVPIGLALERRDIERKQERQDSI